MNKAAILSDDGRYRYLLERQWDERPRMAWCMLNPSTADANIDDQTIKRCIGFAKREGFGGIIVVNLMAFRATSPAVCFAQDDPYGPLNDEYLRIAANRTAKGIVCAWGACATKRAVERAIRSIGKVCLWHLGFTKYGQPRHPLRLETNTPLTLWHT